MIKAQIAGDFLSDGISVRVLMENDGGRLILLPGEDGGTRWESSTRIRPWLTARRTDDQAACRSGPGAARALLRYYEGASDMHTVRSDLLHERGRVDKLTDALIRLADAEAG